ncbi:Uncharacterised protein [uncultured archaeon]|nr:Uncharacterised protein [uncultured archaeon]
MPPKAFEKKTGKENEAPLSEKLFRMEITWDESGEPRIQTESRNAPVHDVVAALSNTLYQYNKIWNEEGGFYAKPKKK